MCTQMLHGPAAPQRRAWPRYNIWEDVRTDVQCLLCSVRSVRRHAWVPAIATLKSAQLSNSAAAPAPTGYTLTKALYYIWAGPSADLIVL